MTEDTGVSKRSNMAGCPIIGGTPTVCQEGMLLAYAPHFPTDQPSPWPFKREALSALAWWRTLPVGSIHGGDGQHLLATLRQVSVLHGDEDVRAALRGETDGAIAAALAAMPISEITLQVDIVMSLLLSAALNRNAAACLVLAQVIGLTDLDHPHSVEIAASWLSYGRRYSSEPDKFSEAAAILWQEFGERHNAANTALVQSNEATSPLSEPRA